MTIKCGADEIYVPQHCRARRANTRNKDREQMREFLESNVPVDEHEVGANGVVDTFIEGTIRLLNRSPEFTAEAVEGMRHLRGKIPDAEKRYREVVRHLEDETGFLRKSLRMKRAVFTILLNRRR